MTTSRKTTKTVKSATATVRNPVSAEAAAPAEAAGQAEREAAKAKADAVTQRREQVAKLTGEGLTRHQIAARLEVSMYVVRNDQHATGLTAVRPDRAGQVSPKRADVTRLAGEGKTTAQIAEATGLSVAGVRHHLYAAGVTAALPGREVSPHRATVAAMTAEGKSAREIAEATGLSVAGVRHHIKALRADA